MELKELPKNEDAERNLIGLTLLEKRIPTAASDLAVTEFCSPNYRAAWAAFLELDADGREIEPISAAEIIKRGGGSIGAVELTQTTVGMIHVNEKIFVDKIRDASRRRYLMRELYSTIEKVQSGEVSLDSLKNKLDTLETNISPAGHFKSLADILEKEVRPALLDLRHGITHRISTGFEKIDEVIGGGLSASDVVIVAALTGAGKSAFVLQLATNIARQDIPVAFVSGEMTNKENGLRLLSQTAKVWNLNAATHIDGHQLNFLEDWVDALKALPIYFDSTTFDLQSLSRSLRTLVQSAGVRVLVIDYLQLFKTTKNDRTKRTERIAEASQEVKRIAMELGVAVIEVVQFNREGAKSLKTSMHDLEGSSQLEKDASLIFIIDRDDDSTDIKLRLVKGRNAGKVEIGGTFQGMTLNFEF